jgi:integrase
VRGCRPLTDDEIARVIRQFRGRHARRDRAFFLTGLKTGLRCRELVGLQIADVWCDRILERIEIRRAITKGKRCGASLPLHAAAAAALDEYIRTRGSNLRPHDPLFVSAKPRADGSPRSLDRSAAWRRLKKAFEAAAVHGNVGTHSLRKSYCKAIYRALGNDLIATGVAMRHANVTSTIRYLSFDAEQVERAILAA